MTSEADWPESTVETMTGFRDRIDVLDAKMIYLLGERFAVIDEVAAFKKLADVPVVLPDRIEEIKNRAVELGLTCGLDPDFLRDLYDRIIAASIAREE
ncbi:MAG: chorismate mutase [Pseudomonadota bacterium]|nr:chorismate mutase [Pseudomonadota bacterium]